MVSWNSRRLAFDDVDSLVEEMQGEITLIQELRVPKDMVHGSHSTPEGHMLVIPRYIKQIRPAIVVKRSLKEFISVGGVFFRRLL